MWMPSPATRLEHRRWGDAENFSEAQQGLVTALEYLVMFVITLLMFSSVQNVVAIWLTVVLALVGFMPIFITGIPFSFVTLISLLNLSRIRMRNGIVMVAEFEQQ